jgi:hypothetical protein
MSNWKTIELEGYKLQVDVEKTYEANQKIPPTEYQCSCNYCLNFSMAVESATPKFFEILDLFGLDKLHTSEVYESDFKDGVYTYAVFYHIVGKFEVNDTESSDIYQNKIIQFSDELSIWFMDSGAPIPVDFPEPYFIMECWLKLPRLLSYPYISQAVPVKKAGKIKTVFANFDNKRIKNTLFGNKFEVRFLSEKKYIVLFVNKELFNYFEDGWVGQIEYYDKTLYGISL